LLYGVGFVLYYALQAALNAAFDLGQAVDPAQLLSQLPPEQAAAVPPTLLLVLVGIQSVVLGPFLGLLLGFGEEFGWRGTLQRELIALGKVKGILLLGVIWGIWHAPVIAMGHNYPGYPILGILVMTGYTVGLGFALGHVMLKSGSVLLVAWLHALNNQVWSFLILVVYRPADPVFSFGTGLYGLVPLAVVVAALLLDPIWRPANAQAG
jgi:membrane protease YdiL (CAAX protease family)